MPSSAWTCRSIGRAGCSPGRVFIRERFFTQPVIPDEYFPPVNAFMSGAPPRVQIQTLLCQNKMIIIFFYKKKPFLCVGASKLRACFYVDGCVNKSGEGNYVQSLVTLLSEVLSIWNTIFVTKCVLPRVRICLRKKQIYDWTWLFFTYILES